MATTPESTTSVERPREQVNVLKWMQQNLFSSWSNTLLTVVSLLLIYLVASSLLSWVFFYAEWQVIQANMRLLLVGTYPIDQLWRVWLCVAMAALLLGLSRGVWPDVIGTVAPAYGALLLFLALLPLGEPSNRLWLALCGALIFGGWFVGRWLASTPQASRWSGWVGTGWVVFLPLVLLLLSGFEPVLPAVATRHWGGLLLTFVLAISAIVFSFPLGVLLAIGRRSSLPAVSWFSTFYIELFRGVPLVTVLFMFLIMLPLFVPGGENADNIIRAIVGFTLFTAAYIAENVRGGLQAIPKGQVEAAKALGLNPVYTMTFIVLPQALRIVIPSNVSQYVSLFKDTALVVVAGGGMLELLGIARSIANQDAFLGRFVETLAFAGLVYWVFAFSMTYVSKRLEKRLGVRQR